MKKTIMGLIVVTVAVLVYLSTNDSNIKQFVLGSLITILGSCVVLYFDIDNREKIEKEQKQIFRKHLLHDLYWEIKDNINRLAAWESNESHFIGFINTTIEMFNKVKYDYFQFDPVEIITITCGSQYLS